MKFDHKLLLSRSHVILHAYPMDQNWVLRVRTSSSGLKKVALDELRSLKMFLMNPGIGQLKQAAGVPILTRDIVALSRTRVQILQILQIGPSLTLRKFFEPYAPMMKISLV